MADYRDESFAARHTSFGRLTMHKTNDTIWHNGYVVTPDGIVGLLFSEPRSTIFEFVHRGRHYYRRFDKHFKPRYLVTLAKRFAAETVEEDTA